MGNKEDKRKKDLRRRLAPAEQGRAEERRGRSEEVMELVRKELGDPARIPIHLQRLGQLAFALPALRELRLPPPFPAAVLELRPPAEIADPVERLRAHRAALAARAARADLLPAYERMLEKAMGELERMEDLLGIAAARALLASCRETPEVWTHPFWALLVELSLTEMWMTGVVLVELVLESARTTPEELGPQVARALAQGELSRELLELGVSETDPQALAGSILAQIHADRPELPPYELEFDAVLHLVGLHAGLAAHLAERVAKEGLSDPVRAEILTHYEEAYEDDVTPELVGEVLSWVRAHLSRLRDAPETAFGGQVDPARLERERLRAAGLYAGLRLFGPKESKLLRAMHARALHRAPRLASEHERPSVQKLWANPKDLHALEEYEEILRELRQPNRAQRVRVYLMDLRQARKAAEAEKGQASAQG